MKLRYNDPYELPQKIIVPDGDPDALKEVLDFLNENARVIQNAERRVSNRFAKDIYTSWPRRLFVEAVTSYRRTLDVFFLSQTDACSFFCLFFHYMFY